MPPRGLYWAGLLEAKLFLMSIFRLLVADVLSDRCLIQADCAHAVTSRPESTTTNHAARLLAEAHHLRRALPFQQTNDMRDRVFRRYLQAQVNMIPAGMPLDDVNAFDTRPFLDRLDDNCSFVPVEFLPAALRNPDHVVLTVENGV